MLKYLNYEKTIFHKRFGKDTWCRAENVFLLGEDWEGAKSQANSDGQLSLLDRGGY